MDNTFASACNAVEHVDAHGKKQLRNRFFTVVDGRNGEFQRELDRLSLTGVRECASVKDHRTNCFLRMYKVRSREGDAFRQATEDLAEHMPELGYPDYQDYALKALVEYGVISAKKPGSKRENPARNRNPWTIIRTRFLMSPASVRICRKACSGRTSRSSTAVSRKGCVSLPSAGLTI